MRLRSDGMHAAFAPRHIAAKSQVGLHRQCLHSAHDAAIRNLEALNKLYRDIELTEALAALYVQDRSGMPPLTAETRISFFFVQTILRCR